MKISPLFVLPFLVTLACGESSGTSGSGDGDGDVGDGDLGDGDSAGGGSANSGGSLGDGDGDGDGGTGGSVSGAGGASVGTGGTGGGGGAGGAGTGGQAAPCTEDCEGMGFTCCNGACVNAANDINNCGTCGEVCEGAFPYCNGGSCDMPPCSGDTCGAETSCCGAECCGENQLCCQVNIGPGVLGCFDTVGGTCPRGCPMCDCAHPDTPIATPSGEVPISDLRIGDLVYSIDEHGIVIVPLLQVNRTEVTNHTVLSIHLENGRELLISADHPLGDGRLLSDLNVGETLHGASIAAVHEVAYGEPATYDILPATSSGIYFAAGLPIGSTLAEAPRRK